LPELADRLRDCCSQGIEAAGELQQLMNERFGLDAAVELKSLRGMLDALAAVLPGAADAAAALEADTAEAGSGGAGPARSASGGLQGINSRQDAVKAIQMVCAYLDQSEPTNPAQLLLRRAERLIDKNFLDLIKDLAPDASAEVARILGVTVSSDDD
jgi:type VI secretion system protein ImpA